MFVIRIVTLFIVMLPQVYLQQIFEENSSTCEFENEIDNNRITVPNKLWQIRGINRQKDSVIKLSICDLAVSIPECDVRARVCTINKQRKRDNVKNAGTAFVYTKDDTGKNIFKSINGELCDEDENEKFTTIIEFNHNEDMSVAPKFKFMGDCELRIEMLHPEYQPPCTLKKMGNFIDMRQLKHIQTDIEDSETNMKFSIRICSMSNKCDADVSVCQFWEGGQSKAISVISSQHVVYKDGTYSIKGHTTENRKKRLNFILNLKCNWKTDGINKLRYLKPSQQGKTFHFTAESSAACIKLPIVCMVRDTFRNNFLYDLRSLYRADGWVVKNVSNSRIVMNMCGRLTHADSTECAVQHSQVCLTKNGQQINLGSLQKGIKVTSEDTVVTSFTDGSACTINGTEGTYSTGIEFLCKAGEEGPVLHNIDGCVYKIKWYTVTACAKNIPIGDDCRVTDLSGPINLNQLRQNEDMTHILTPNSFLRYNLCGPLKKLCNNNTDAAVCLIDNNKEHVLGRKNSTVVFMNDKITTNLKGDKCLGKSNSAVNINYKCNHLVSSPSGQVEVNILRDGCDYELNIASPVACSPASFFSCKFSTGNRLYDLSQLIKNDSNYEIKYGGNLYSFNLCRSVIRTSNAQCSAYAGICMKNLTEWHSKNMYESLGMVNSDSQLILESGELTIEYKLGQLRLGDDLCDRSSKIRFKCSRREEGPKFLNKSSCHHEFVWRTPKACPLALSNQRTRSIESCVFVDPITKHSVDLLKSNKDIILSTKNESFKLSPCSTHFTYCPGNNNSICSLMNNTFTLRSLSSGPLLMYHLFSTPCINGAVNSVNINVSCKPNLSTDEVDVINIENCTLYVNLKTSLICNPATKAKSYEILQKEPESIESISKESCNIEEMDNFSLKNLRHMKVVSMQNITYTFNFDGKENCTGLVCRNDTSVESDIDSCPLTQVSPSDSTVRLIYKSTKCLDGIFRSEILLKCDNTSVPVVLKESDCSVAVTYPLKEVCTWFPHTEELEALSTASTNIAVGSSIGAILFLAIVVGGIRVYKKRGMQRRASYDTISSDKERLHVYCKNAQL